MRIFRKIFNFREFSIRIRTPYQVRIKIIFFSNTWLIIIVNRCADADVISPVKILYKVSSKVQSRLSKRLKIDGYAKIDSPFERRRSWAKSDGHSIKVDIHERKF